MQEVAVDDKAAVIHHLSFNQDCSCFSIGTSNGFVVFNSDPLKVRPRPRCNWCHAMLPFPVAFRVFFSFSHLFAFGRSVFGAVSV